MKTLTKQKLDQLQTSADPLQRLATPFYPNTLKALWHDYQTQMNDVSSLDDARDVRDTFKGSLNTLYQDMQQDIELFCLKCLAEKQIFVPVKIIVQMPE